MPWELIHLGGKKTGSTPEKFIVSMLLLSMRLAKVATAPLSTLAAVAPGLNYIGEAK
jgi:hypothetical protein